MEQRAIIKDNGQTFTTHYTVFKLLGLNVEGWQKTERHMPLLPNGTEVTIVNEITHNQFGDNIQICLIEDVDGLNSVIIKTGLEFIKTTILYRVHYSEVRQDTHHGTHANEQTEIIEAATYQEAIDIVIKEAPKDLFQLVIL